MIAVLPYPFLSYISSVQNYRYQKIYMIIGACTAINIAGVVLLQVLMLAGICEIGLVYMESAQANGIALCIGLVLLLVAAGLKSIRDMINIEKEKQSAIAASESKAQFLANMSHEIRTPMNTVLGMNDMILMENKDEKIDEYARNIKSAGQLLLGLINDILDFSKIEAGKLQIVEKEYPLAELLKDFVLSSQLRAKQKDLEMLFSGRRVFLRKMDFHCYYLLKIPE